MTEPTPAEPDDRGSESTMTATELVEPPPMVLQLPVDVLEPVRNFVCEA